MLTRVVATVVRRAMVPLRTRAQEAWSLAQQATKAVAAIERREHRRVEADARYALRVAKQKQKHRGK